MCCFQNFGFGRLFFEHQRWSGRSLKHWFGCPVVSVERLAAKHDPMSTYSMGTFPSAPNNSTRKIIWTSGDKHPLYPLRIYNSSPLTKIDPIISAIDRGFIALRPSPKLLEAALIFARSNNFTREHGDPDWSGFDGSSLVFIVDGVLQDAGCRMVFVLEKLWEIGPMVTFLTFSISESSVYSQDAGLGIYDPNKDWFYSLSSLFSFSLYLASGLIWHPSVVSPDLIEIKQTFLKCPFNILIRRLNHGQCCPLHKVH